MLVDAGLNRKETLRRLAALGASVDRVDAILISHEHSDHITGLPGLSRQWRAPVFLTPQTRAGLVAGLAEGVAEKLGRVETIHAGQRFMIGDIEICAFSIPHDAADPVGYSLRVNGSKVAIVTDLGFLPAHVQQHLREADCLILESNHDVEMLKVGPYPWHIKQRVMSRTGHLSNHTVGEFLSDGEAFDARARWLVLAHLSENNNNPHVARLCAEQALCRRPVECAFRGEVQIATQLTPLGPFDL
ncbi:MAG: MBL fold metallo-hydrolase [Acidipila sp.]|nr:MBL fold metallo-hydrolase [Acidipila sp.]